MLTVVKKALILAQAGIEVPQCLDFDASTPWRHSSGKPSFASELTKSDTERAIATTRWNQKIEELFVIYTADRAAKSLREAEQLRQIDMLRRANIRPQKNQ